MNDQVAVSLNLADGRTLRFGGDEKDALDVPTDISWETTIPGGFGAASVTLPRPANLYADDARLFSDLVIYGPGAKVLYEGYVTAVPQVGTQEIQLQTSGWSTTLERIQTFREIFVDRDLGRWGDPSRTRRDALKLAGYNEIEGGSVEQDGANGLPALTLTAPNAAVNPIKEATYNAPAGVKISQVYYDYTSFASSSFGAFWVVATNDAVTTFESSSDLITTTNASGTGTFAPSARYPHLLINFQLTGTVSGDSSLTLRKLAVYGNHGITLRGSDPKGVYASDVVSYVISKSPLTATSDSVEPTSFVIPHLIYPEDTSLRQVIEEVTILGGQGNVPNDWGAYDNKTFFWRSPGTYGRTWRVRRDQVATAQSEGPDADLRTAGVKVSYTDAAGTSKSVGPIGSNADYETNELLDIDPDNPAFRIQGAYATESVGITSQEGAVNIGKLILNERNRLQWRGSITLQGEATDENGNTYPVAEVRAGDQIIVEDDADLTPRPVNSTSYSHSSLTLSANVGARPDSLESLLGQLAAVTDIFGT